MYNSQYYTCEEIDQRLLQNYLDDYNSQNNTSLTKAQFLQALYNMFNNGLTLGNIVQVVGSNADKVMSQAVVTELLEAVANAINEGSLYLGILPPSANPGNHTTNVFALVKEVGTYTYFKDQNDQPIVISNEGVYIFNYNVGGDYWISTPLFQIDTKPTPNSTSLVRSGSILNSIIKDGSAFDLSAYNNGATYNSLSDALIALNTLPDVYKQGGMSIKYVQTSDNKYVQYLYKAVDAATAATFTNVANWEKINLNGEVSLLEQKVAELDGAIEDTPVKYEFVSVANAYINYENGEVVANNNYRVTDFIRVQPGDTVKVSHFGVAAHMAVIAAFSGNDVSTYDGNNSVNGNGNVNDYTYTVPQGVYYIRLSSHHAYLATAYYSIYRRSKIYETFDEITNNLFKIFSAFSLSDNSTVNKIVKYLYDATGNVNYSRNATLRIAWLNPSDQKYYNQFYIPHSTSSNFPVFANTYNTKTEALDALINTPVRVSTSVVCVLNADAITEDIAGEYNFKIVNSIQGASTIFDKHIARQPLFVEGLGNTIFSEILTFRTDGYVLNNVYVAKFLELNSTSGKYEIDLQTAYTKSGSANQFGVIVKKIGENGFSSRADAIAYYNENLADKVFPMEDGFGFVRFNRISNIADLPTVLSGNRLYLAKDTGIFQNANEIVEHIGKLDGEIFAFDTVLNPLIEELYLDPNKTDYSTITKIRLSVGGTIGGTIYNLCYIYRENLATKTLFQTTYPSVSAALSAFRGVLGNSDGLIKVNDDFAATLKNGFLLDVNISDINLNKLSFASCPKLQKYLYPFDNLIGKQVIWEGDSIAAANAADNIGWRRRIEDKHAMVGVSYALGGSTITNNVEGLQSTHWMATRIDSIVQTSPNCDYFIFDGGTNDADRIGSIVQVESGSGDAKIIRKPRSEFPEKFGSWADRDFSGNYDKDTFCGALEYIIWKVLTQYKGKKIGFIVAPKMGITAGSQVFSNRLEYFREAMAICKKWGVPFINLWEDSWMNPNLPNQYDPEKTGPENISAGNYYVDGQHPTPTGYVYLSKLIEDWMNKL